MKTIINSTIDSLKEVDLLEAVQLLRFYNLHKRRQFLSAHMQKLLLEHLQPIKINPLNILNISLDSVYDSQKLLHATYPKSKIINFVPIILNNSSKFQNNYIKVAALLQKLKQKFNLNNCQTIYASWHDAVNTNLGEIKFDIIYSNYALNYFNLINILPVLYNLLNGNGLIIFSSFGLGSLDKINIDNKVLPLLDMHDVGDALLKYGFSSPVIDAQRLQLNYSGSMAYKTLLKDLQAFGVFMRNIQIRNAKNMVREIIHSCRNINALNLELVFAHAWKNSKKIINQDYQPIKFIKS